MNTKQDAPITDADREAALAALDPSGLEDLWGEDVTRVAQAIANARAAGAKAAQQSPVPGLVARDMTHEERFSLRRTLADARRERERILGDLKRRVEAKGSEHSASPWTSTPPTEPGVYWGLLGDGSKYLVERMQYRRPPHDAKVWVWEIVGGDAAGAEVLVVQWCGPVTPPELPR